MPPESIDDHEINEGECHEHHLGEWKQAMHPSPRHQLTDCNEERGSNPRFGNEASQQVVDHSRENAGYGSRKHDRQASRKREGRDSSFHMGDDTHQQPTADSENEQSQERPTQEI
jgi:hypothetical protein